MESVRELRKICIKQGINFKSRVLSYISLYVTRIILPTSITPTQIAAFWMVLKFIAILMLIPGKYIYALVGMLILQFAILLDNVDGQVARYKKIYPKAGWYIDFISHNMTVPLTFICLGIGIYNAFGQIEYVFLGFTTAVVNLIRETTTKGKILFALQVTREMGERRRFKKTLVEKSSKIKSFVRRFIKDWFEMGECISLMVIGIVLYLWREVLWFYFIIIVINFIFKTSLTFWELSQNDRKLLKKKK